jgi:peroxidase
MYPRRKLVSCEKLEDRQLMAGDLNAPALPPPALHPPTSPPLSLTPRSYDGTGNNLKQTEWGSTGEDFLRRAPAEYGDGISSLAGESRQSAREISNLVVDQNASEINNRQLTDIVWQWGQFIDHDLDLTLAANPPESAPIAVPAGDAEFDPANTGAATIGFTRSIYNTGTGNAASNPRQQLNSITSWIDGSMIYGSSKATADSLRTFSGGLMKTSEGNLLPTDEKGNFLAGDIRVNEQIGLISMQTLFVREHNRVATGIAARHPQWSDERVFQQARAFVIGEVQAITYNEFLPALLGVKSLRPYAGYRPQVNPNVSNEFATAAFRVGHTMLSPELLRLNNDGTEIAAGNIALRDSFFNPQAVKDTNIGPILKGLATQQAQEIDNQLVDEVRNFLFGPPGAGGFDLASLNIQRGRDHGLADYNQTRAAFGLPKVTSFAQISSDPETQSKLAAAYNSVDDIDLWVGALAEDHAPGASVGPLVQRVVADQFLRVRDGDRYWYQRAFQGEELRRLENTHLADVIRRNTGLTQLQRNVFFSSAAPQNQLPPPAPPKPEFPKPNSPPFGGIAPAMPRPQGAPNTEGNNTPLAPKPPLAPAKPQGALPNAGKTMNFSSTGNGVNTTAADQVFNGDTNELLPPLWDESSLTGKAKKKV